MCGIVGYLGSREVMPILLEGLQKLEYRGYDSAGIANIASEGFEVYRSEGKLANLRELLQSKKAGVNGSASVEGLNVGIGHTRWATHGKPSETNAHPHVAGRVCVVHNGIIENYLSLRERLQKEGCQIVSETDTEIAAQLINSYLAKTDCLLSAVRAATEELHGSYALVVMSLDQPDRLVLAKNATPIIIGLGDNENFIASDIPAIINYTRDVVVLEDGDLAEITADKVVLEHAGESVERKPIRVTWDPITAEKGGYRHFMLKEIYEQPTVVTETFRGRINQTDGSVFLDDVSLSEQELKEIKRVCIVACGTAWHAALVTRFYIEEIAGIPVEVDYGSEFRYRRPFLDESTLFVVISQSGETADTLGRCAWQSKPGLKLWRFAMSLARQSRARRITCSTLTPAQRSASPRPRHFQLNSRQAIFSLCAWGLPVRRFLRRKFRSALRSLSVCRLTSQAPYSTTSSSKRLHANTERARTFSISVGGCSIRSRSKVPLKLKEISYVHAEGYPAGEMKHGPIALISEETPVVIVIGQDGVNYEKVMSNLMEVESRGGRNNRSYRCGNSRTQGTCLGNRCPRRDAAPDSTACFGNSAATSCLPCGRLPRHGCRPAEKFGQERDCRVIFFAISKA